MYSEPAQCCLCSTAVTNTTVCHGYIASFQRYLYFRITKDLLNTTQSNETAPTTLFLKHTTIYILIPVSSSSWHVKNGCMIRDCPES